MDDGLIGFLCGGFIGGLGGLLIGAGIPNSIPIEGDKKVEPGYVQPSKLKINCNDLNGNDMYETLLKYNGKQYLLQEDKEGNPIIKDYNIVPKE